jgi:hypothetical protein
LRRCWEEILAVYLDVKGNRLEWVNEYSLDYVNRKIHVYTSLLNRHRYTRNVAIPASSRTRSIQ